MYYIYNLYSAGSNLYYLGNTDNPVRRLHEHNSSPFNTYTSKHRTCVLKSYFQCGPSESDATKLEQFIKKQKSRKLIEQLCDKNFVPTGF